MKFLKIFGASLLAFVVGSVLCCLLWISVLLGLAGGSNSKVAVAKHSILKIDMAELITDAPARNPFSNMNLYSLEQTRTLPLLKVLRALEAAAADDRIEGICISPRLGGGVVSTAVLEELRAALEEFKKSGKFIVAYSDTYSQGQYYLASVADRIYLQPEGMIDWRGMAMTAVFFKPLFDRAGIRAEIFRPTACKYKSAVEPYFLDRMSPENREQSQQLVDSVWEVIGTTVAEARGIDPKLLDELTDNLQTLMPLDALKHNLVDGLIYEDQLDEIYENYGVDTDIDTGYEYISLGEYASTVGADYAKLSADAVAIVYADGSIYDGEGRSEDIYGDQLAATLAGVRYDDSVKAVVLRVNSPGGSALASDVIWREVELLKAEKPVIVSMGGYAASGGYYISCPADAILADRTTLTGSIGVFGLMLDGQKFLNDKLRLSFDGVKTNTSADMGHGVFGLQIRPLTAAERNVMIRSVDKVYESFTSKVAEGRNLPLERVLEIAGGRVWSGVDALQIGLIDSCGGLKQAIAVAADKAGLTDYRVTEVEEELTGLMAFLAAFSEQVRCEILAARSGLGISGQTWEAIAKQLPQNGLIMNNPYRLEL